MAPVPPLFQWKRITFGAWENFSHITISLFNCKIRRCESEYNRLWLRDNKLTLILTSSESLTRKRLVQQWIVHISTTFSSFFFAKKLCNLGSIFVYNIKVMPIYVFAFQTCCHNESPKNSLSFFSILMPFSRSKHNVRRLSEEQISVLVFDYTMHVWIFLWTRYAIFWDTKNRSFFKN